MGCEVCGMDNICYMFNNIPPVIKIVIFCIKKIYSCSYMCVSVNLCESENCKLER